MGKKQMLGLFTCYFVLWAVGSALSPLLPYSVSRWGMHLGDANPYFAYASLALAAGALSAVWVSDRLKRRKVPLIASVIAVSPLIMLMGQATSIWALTALTVLVWFCVGLSQTLIFIMAGLSAREGERGRIFGLLALGGVLGEVLINPLVLYLVDYEGFATTFGVLAYLLTLAPLACLLLEEKQDEGVRCAEVTDAPAGGLCPGLGRNYWLVCAAGLVIALAGAVQKYSTRFMEVSPGLLLLLVPLLMGWLSDRRHGRNRKPMLYLSYLGMLACLVILAASPAQVNFRLVVVLGMFATISGGVIVRALTVDVVPPASLARGLALLNAIAWLGDTAGTTVAANVLYDLGTKPTLITGALLVVLAIVLFALVRTRRNEAVAVTAVTVGTGVA